MIHAMQIIYWGTGWDRGPPLLQESRRSWPLTSRLRGQINIPSKEDPEGIQQSLPLDLGPGPSSLHPFIAF